MPSQIFFIDFEHRYSCVLCRLAILKNTYSNVFAERLQWLLLNITLLIGSIQGFNRICLETFSIQILFLKNLYHLNSKSKENFLNIEVYGVFLLTFILRVKNKGDSLGWCS